MPGTAAVAFWCDVDLAIKDEFEDWHAHEHMPERLAIPGFLRGSRWVSVDGRNSQFVLYELASLEVLTAGPYLERLNNPTPWSTKMMPHHRNMVRSLCRVESSFGVGLGELMLTVRLAQSPDVAQLPAFPVRKGLVAVHLLRDAGAVQGAQTAEQKIRGGDKTADWIVLVNGYGIDAVTRAAGELDRPGAISRIYRLAYTLGGKI